MPSPDVTVTGRVFEKHKCDKGLAAGLQRSPRTPSRSRGMGPASKEKRMDREGNGRELPPLYLTSGYGPDVALVQTMLSIQHVLLKPE